MTFVPLSSTLQQPISLTGKHVLYVRGVDKRSGNAIEFMTCHFWTSCLSAKLVPPALRNSAFN